MSQPSTTPAGEPVAFRRQRPSIARALAVGGMAWGGWVAGWILFGLGHALWLGGLERFVATLIWGAYGLGSGLAFAVLVAGTVRWGRLSAKVGALWGAVSGWAGVPVMAIFSADFGWYWLLVFAGDALLGALVACGMAVFDTHEPRG